MKKWVDKGEGARMSPWSDEHGISVASRTEAWLEATGLGRDFYNNDTSPETATRIEKTIIWPRIVSYSQGEVVEIQLITRHHSLWEGNRKPQYGGMIKEILEDPPIASNRLGISGHLSSFKKALSNAATSPGVICGFLSLVSFTSFFRYLYTGSFYPVLFWIGLFSIMYLVADRSED